MNMFSRIFNHQSGGKPLASLSPGEFWIFRSPSSPKGQRELIFTNAELTLNSTTRDNFVQIQIADLNGEKSQDDTEFPLDKEDNSYLVHPGLELGYSVVDDKVVIAWKDLESEGDTFEFICSSSVTSESLETFDTVACESLYLQSHEKLPSKDKREEAFAALMKDYSENGRKKQNATKETENNSADYSTNKGNDTALKNFTLESQDFGEGELKHSVTCDLCIFDSSRNVFMSPENLRSVQAVVLDQGNYKFSLEIRKDDAALLNTPIEPNDLNQYIDIATKSLVFNYICEDGTVMSYLLLFKTEGDLTDFDTVLSIALYEICNRKKWEKLAEPDKDYLINALSGWNMKYDTEADEDNDAEEDDDDESSEDEEDAEEDDDEGDFGAQNERNSALEIGHVNDRTYVVRGDKIGVFSNANHNLKHSTTIENVGFDPDRILLHDRDRSLILQNKNNANNLYRMDLETGKIVDEWESFKQINDFNPVSKFAQTTGESTLLGVSGKSMYYIDPRVAEGIVNTKTEKTYSQNLGFSNICATADGFFAVGDKRGAIRLFSEMGKVAKTLIPGLGDPIVGLDVTADGKYVLATCKSYLLLIETQTNDINGFNQLWPVDSRPKPRKLMITPENLSYMYQVTKQPISFTPARFNISTNSKEATIVTSTGPYLVTWDLKKILRNEKSSYRIKQYKSQITAENFEFGTDQRVILTLADDVNIVSKRALKNPDQVLRQGSQ